MKNANTQIMGVDLSATRASKPIRTNGKRVVRAHLDWVGTGTPVGAWTLEGSEDVELNDDWVNNPTPTTISWVTLTVPAAGIHGTGLTVSGGTPGKTLVILADPPTFIRVVYTRGSGGSADSLARVWIGHSD